MARNLQKAGFDVTGFDLSEQVRKDTTASGINNATSIKDAVANADYVVTCLPKTEHVESVLKQAGGIFESAKKGAYICDVSTISPFASADFYADAKKHGINFLDTPMSGGIMGAIAGTLTFMVGGEKQEFEHAKVVLDAMGKNTFHCGKPGSGEVAKIANNLVLGINMIAASESLAMGEKLGLDPKVLKQICDVSSGRSFVMDTYNPVPGLVATAPANKDYNEGFQVGLVKKDLNLAIEAGKQGGADMSMTEFANTYY